MSAQPTLFDAARLTNADAWGLTIASLQAYGPKHEHWAIAWSGGKDSTATLTFVLWALQAGEVARPKTLTVLYVDTRLELPALAFSALTIIAQLREQGIDVRVVMAPLDKRFMVYLLGRGVPPPNNGTLRWCTEQIKVKPMEADLVGVAVEHGLGEMVMEDVRGVPRLRYRGFGQAKILMLTGVRQGESAIRDQRIVMSCSKGASECGQGWFQETMPDALCDTLAPLLHWRVCNVWDWLALYAPTPDYGGWDTALLAEAYGGDERDELNARTGCIGCPLTDKDTALDALIRRPEWSYLAPLKELRRLWRALRLPEHRHRKHGGETRQDGSLVENQYRMGPITLDSRAWALEVVLDIQTRVNAAADAAGRPRIDILNDEEVARIREMHAQRVFPQKWSGDEPLASEFFSESGDLFSAALQVAPGRPLTILPPAARFHSDA